MQMLKIVFLMFFLILWGCAKDDSKPGSLGLKSSSSATTTSTASKAEGKTHASKAKKNTDFPIGGD